MTPVRDNIVNLILTPSWSLLWDRMCSKMENCAIHEMDHLDVATRLSLGHIGLRIKDGIREYPHDET
jgi:hypothetical protein